MVELELSRETLFSEIQQLKEFISSQQLRINNLEIDKNVVRYLLLAYCSFDPTLRSDFSRKISFSHLFCYYHYSLYTVVGLASFW